MNDQGLESVTPLPKPAPCLVCGRWTGVMGKPEVCPSCVTNHVRERQLRGSMTLSGRFR